MYGDRDGMENNVEVNKISIQMTFWGGEIMDEYLVRVGLVCLCIVQCLFIPCYLNRENSLNFRFFVKSTKLLFL